MLTVKISLVVINEKTLSLYSVMCKVAQYKIKQKVISSGEINANANSPLGQKLQ